MQQTEPTTKVLASTALVAGCFVEREISQDTAVSVHAQCNELVFLLLSRASPKDTAIIASQWAVQRFKGVCVCVCVCERERERERECV